MKISSIHTSALLPGFFLLILAASYVSSEEKQTSSLDKKLSEILQNKEDYHISRLAIQLCIEENVFDSALASVLESQRYYPTVYHVFAGYCCLKNKSMSSEAFEKVCKYVATNRQAWHLAWRPDVSLRRRIIAAKILGEPRHVRRHRAASDA